MTRKEIIFIFTFFVLGLCHIKILFHNVILTIPTWLTWAPFFLYSSYLIFKFIRKISHLNSKIEIIQFKKNLLDDALDEWEAGRCLDSISKLRSLVEMKYLPAYPEYLWRIWGNGKYYDEFNMIINEGIAMGSLDCEYIKLWKEFSNRPGDDEYWEKIYQLAEKKQKNALLALGLHIYLKASNKEERIYGIKMVCSSYPCHMSKENIVMIYNKALLEDDADDILNIIRDNKSFDWNILTQTPITNAILHGIKSWPIIINAEEDKLFNEHLSNDDFNATVFTRLRNLEKRRISKGALSYTDILKKIAARLPDSVFVMDGLTKNAWSLTDDEEEANKERCSLYIMKKVSDGWMTLRIGDHTSNLGDYYKYRRMFIPSVREYANLCIMLHGDREQNAGLKYSFRFRADTADPCVTVRDEDYIAYQPFRYTIMHYVPGLIDDVEPLVSAIHKWFAGNGTVMFSDPYRDIEDGPSARMTSGIATIETWDIKYERRKFAKQEI